MKHSKTAYHVHISAQHRWLDLKLDEVWQYRDLIFLFTKRAFTVRYKQTILGPLWLLLHPFLSSLMYTILFGHIAGLSTDGIPKLLFYLTGNALWGYFSSCLTSNADTFVGYAGLFGKVYFPRLTIPLSNVLSALVQLMIQLLLVLGVGGYYLIQGAVHPQPSALPLLLLSLLQLGMLGMGVGIIVSSLTTKYRDLSVLVGFGVQLWMYATPVVYPLSQLSQGTLCRLVLLNPVTMPMECFRRGLLGVGTVSIPYLLLSWCVTLLTMLVGLLIFNRIERTFMDTV